MVDAWLLLAGLLTISGLMYLAGYLDRANDYPLPVMSYECNAYVSKSLNRSGCETTITVGENVTLFINTSFDKVSWYG